MSDYLATFLNDLACMGAGFEDAPAIGPRTRSRVGDTPLHIAAIRGDFQAVALLLNSGADINALGEDGYTSLHNAVEHGHCTIVRFLLEKGADIEIRTYGGAGETAGELAQHLEENEIKTLLQKYDA